MLTKITLDARTRERAPGLAKSYKFKPGVNLLIGPNGSGKSTILKELSAKSESKSKIAYDKPTQFVFFDSEKMNPRVSQFVESSADIATRFMSHGQALKPILVEGLFQAVESARKKDKPKPDVVVLLDEPEAGLDHDALSEFVQAVLKLHKTTQFVIATHALTLWLIPGAHAIEVGESGYAKKVLDQFENLFRGFGPLIRSELK